MAKGVERWRDKTEGENGESDPSSKREERRIKIQIHHRHMRTITKDHFLPQDPLHLLILPERSKLWFPSHHCHCRRPSLNFHCVNHLQVIVDKL
jgi:hypothetical protein